MTAEELASRLRVVLPAAVLARLDLAAPARRTGARCPPYLAMSYLYKRSNRLWHWLIRYRLTALIWRPLVELSRRRHLKFRARLARGADAIATGTVVSAGV